MNRIRTRCDFTFRASTKGGSTLSEAEGPVGRSFRRRKRFVLLVHGYNVALRGAVSDFELFRARMKRHCPEIEQDVLTVSWPGDGRWPFSTASYPWRVGTAVDLGPALAKLIEDLVKKSKSCECEIILVGHSLGCRFILEALHELRVNEKKKETKKIKKF